MPVLFQHQGATRLGGYSSVYVKDGGSPFSQALFINEHWDANLEDP